MPIVKSLSSKDASNMLALLKKFYAAHGHLYIPNTKQYTSLYNLSERIRKNRDHLSGLTKHELEKMGFMWTIKSANDLRWYYHFGELKAFKNKFGHTRVPPRKEPYKGLGTWVLRQRRDQKVLPKESVKLLNSISFEWSSQIKAMRQEEWQQMFQRLQEFYKKNGHSNVPDRYKPDEKLGRWVSTVRYSEQRLETWKKQLLRKVKFKFSKDIKEQRELNRKKLFDKIESFFRMHGHANVPETYKDSKLAVAVAYLRQYPDRIRPDEKRKLKSWKFLYSEDIKERWNNLWEASFRKLQKFKKEFGHCRVSSAYKDKTLARWVANQRKDEQDGKLTPDRKKRLQAIGFSFYKDIAILQEKKWMEMYRKLVRFRDQHGNTIVKEGYKDRRLAYWVQHQRQGRDKMTRHRKELLDKIAFVWRVK